ncbi:hypothetical protein BK809_0006159 [Diplodia seriata]|uniref:HRQ family protein 2 n=2 Tax=Diplodia seriata TaxID=420778 RepID=A0A1S8B2S7_9PEZI|nr:hypothetical protein BK809_0006159 [Diplodia seriata]
MLSLEFSRIVLLASFLVVAVALSFKVLTLASRKARVLEPTIRLSCTRLLMRHQRPTAAGLPNNDKPNVQANKEAYYAITPLRTFDWRETKPIKIRPFKPRYHLTMALENTTISEFIAMDDTYLARLALRRQLIVDHGAHTIAALPTIKPAVVEFYKWMTGVYLPRRFPTVYSHALQPGTGHAYLRNLATDESIPLQPPASTADALRILGSHVDTEFLFLRPSPDPSDEGRYRLEGFANCSPSGFDTLAKLGLRLADIHAPVPGYAQKLERSMDRFFAALPIGRIVKRHNWSVTTNRNLFSLGGNHLYDGEEVRPLTREDVDIDQCVLRCERQTLHRLRDNDDTLVFAFKTYQYPLREIKEEGSGEELAQAVDGLSEGSVPRMAFYKRQVVWGEAVKEFLRA